MFVRIKTYKRPTYRFLLNYIMEERKRQSPDGKSFVMTHNVTGRNIEGWVEQFKRNESFRQRKRRKDGVYFNHEILSWHRDDAPYLTREKLEDMVREYFRLRGPHFMGVATVHTDRANVHVHICSSGLQYRTGKSMRISRKAYADLKKDIQAYHIGRFPELSRSVVTHERKRTRGVSDKEKQYKQRTGKMSQREMAREIVRSCYAKSKSQEDFCTLLKAHGLDTYIRGGRVYGVEYMEKKYRFTRLGIDLTRQTKEQTRINALRKVREKSAGQRISRSRS